MNLGPSWTWESEAGWKPFSNFRWVRFKLRICHWYNVSPFISDRWLQTAYRHVHVLTNLSLVSSATVCSNAAELPFNALWNFVNCLANYRFPLRIFFSLMKLRRKIVLCSSELSVDTPWNFTRTFVRTFIERSRKQRTNFTHFACITFAQYCKSWLCPYVATLQHHSNSHAFRFKLNENGEVEICYQP